MGICASCLGLGRRNSYDNESSHLLYRDDPYQSTYGTLHTTPNGTVTQDPQSAKRERDALLQITQRASDAVIDIFALAPTTMVHSGGAGGGSTKSSKSTHSYSGLIRNVYSVEDFKKNRVAAGDVMGGEMKKDFGTVRRGRQGDLVSTVRLE